MTDTSTTHAAREHARAQAAQARPETWQTIPATAAVDLPEGVRTADVLWDETIPAGGYAARELRRGATLRLTNLQGDGCIQFLVYNAERPIERLNIADTVKVQWQAYPAQGALLLSDMGRALMSLRADTCGRHDAFCGASSAWSNARHYGPTAGKGLLRNARDNFQLALAKYGLGKRDIPANINFFKGVRIALDGKLEFIEQSSAAGQYIDLKAEMHVLVVLANCPHVLDPRPQYSVTPVRALAWRGEPTAQDDPFRTQSPEIERAFLNNDDYFLSVGQSLR